MCVYGEEDQNVPLQDMLFGMRIILSIKQLIDAEGALYPLSSHQKAWHKFFPFEKLSIPIPRDDSYDWRPH